MNTGIITLDTIINKRSAKKIAAEHFLKNKRTSQVTINAYNVNVVLSYKGPRKSQEEIQEQVEIVRFFKKD